MIHRQSRDAIDLLADNNSADDPSPYALIIMIINTSPPTTNRFDNAIPLLFQFNISIDDYPEVVEDTKRALNLVSGDSILQRFPLNVEISLRTTEGDSMVLEVWSLGLNADRCDLTVRASHTIYNRMSILLKSLISVSRVTPAYKLSRRQSADSYQILYRIYVGDPEIHCLGERWLEITLFVAGICTKGADRAESEWAQSVGRSRRS